MMSYSPRTFARRVRVRCECGPTFHDLRRRAFTLVEALVVLGIIILIGGLALPGMTRWSSKYSDSAFQARLQSTVDAARAIAISNAAAVKIRVVRKSGDKEFLIAAWHSARDRRDPNTDREKTIGELDDGFTLTFEDVGADKSEAEGGTTLWTVLPDGSVSRNSDVKVRRADGATAGVSVGTWNGTVTFGPFVTDEKPWFESDGDMSPPDDVQAPVVVEEVDEQAKEPQP